MADQSDIEATLASQISAILYPAGTTSPSVLGSLCRIYRGWPNAAALNTDLASGNITVTVHPGEAFRNTTRHIDPPTPLALISPTLAVTTDATTATITGTSNLGQVVGLLIDNQAFVHRTTVGDSPDSIASTLAGYIGTQRTASASQATITIPGARLIIGRVVADQQTLTTTRRQSQDFRISLWCPDPVSRDTAASLIDTALSAQTFIALPDGTTARIRVVRNVTFDQSQNANLYRRDLVLDADYATTITTTVPALIFGNNQIIEGAGATLSFLG